MQSVTSAGTGLDTKSSALDLCPSTAQSHEKGTEYSDMFLPIYTLVYVLMYMYHSTRTLTHARATRFSHTYIPLGYDMLTPHKGTSTR